MKLDLRSLVIAVAMSVAGCGGGGGGGASTPNTPPASPPVNNTPPPSEPVKSVVVVPYSGSRGDYTIVRTGSNFAVTDSGNTTTNVDGTSVDALRFSDITINLTIGAKATALGPDKVISLIELYMALLNRVPSADDLAYWIDKHSAGTTLAEIAASLYEKALNDPHLTGYDKVEKMPKASDFVTTVYNKAFGRRLEDATTPAEIAAFDAEIKTWSDRINIHDISRPALVLEMLAAARSGSGDLADPAVTQFLDNRIAVGMYFAVDQGINYNPVMNPLVRMTTIASILASTGIEAAIMQIGFWDADFSLLDLLE